MARAVVAAVALALLANPCRGFLPPDFEPLIEDEADVQECDRLGIKGHDCAVYLLGDNIRHHVEPLPVVRADEWMDARNLPFRTGRRAFKLVGLHHGMADWQRWDLDGIVEELGPAIAEFHPEGGQALQSVPIGIELPLAIEALYEELEDRYDAGLPPAYVMVPLGLDQWSRMWREECAVALPNGTTTKRCPLTGGRPLPPFLDEGRWWRDACFDSHEARQNFFRSTKWKLLIIGAAGSGVPNHIDMWRVSSWQYTAAGRKLWQVCPPAFDGSGPSSDDLSSSGYSEALVSLSEEERDLWAAAPPNMLSAVDALRPDYDEFPALLNISCYLDIMEPGEIIFYPQRHWHQTLGLDTPNIALSNNAVLGLSDLEGFRHELTDRCRKLTNGLQPSTCARLPECWRLMRHGYGHWDSVLQDTVPRKQRPEPVRGS